MEKLKKNKVGSALSIQWVSFEGIVDLRSSPRTEQGASSRDKNATHQDASLKGVGASAPRVVGQPRLRAGPVHPHRT